MICACGCGRETLMSQVTGQPNTYLRGHNQRRVPSFSRQQPTLDRFWGQVVEQPSGCWEWVGPRNKNGYGAFGMSVRGKTRVVLAHRFSYEIHTRLPLPDGVFVLHRCDNPPCVRPAHLFPGDHLANARDMSTKGRAATGENGRHGVAKLTPDIARAIREEHARDVAIRVLAARYGVTVSTLYPLLRGLTWRTAGGPRVAGNHSADSNPSTSLVTEISIPDTEETPPNAHRRA